MPLDRRALIALLHQELIRSQRGRGGAGFDETKLCLNFGTQGPLEPCHRCALLEFVPAEARDHTLPCLAIPLDKQGRSLEILAERVSRRSCQEAVQDWMEKTLARLEREQRLEDALNQPRQPPA